MHSCIDGIAVSWPMRRAHELIERRADVEVGALRLLRMRLREEHRARPEVVAADLRRVERFGHAYVGVADDRQILPPRLERRQRALGDELEVSADAGWRPQILRRAPGVRSRGAVHRLDAHQSRLVGDRRIARRLAKGPERRLHRVEIREGDGRSQTAQEGATLECSCQSGCACASLDASARCRLLFVLRLPRRASARLLRKALLFTTPMMKDDTR